MIVLRVGLGEGLRGADTFENLGRGGRMASQDIGDGVARRSVHLIDQSQCELNVLLLFLSRMSWPLHVKRRQRQQQTRSHVGARPLAKSCQNIPVDHCHACHATARLWFAKPGIAIAVRR
jgi:hypothetical protein